MERHRSISSFLIFFYDPLTKTTPFVLLKKNKKNWLGICPASASSSFHFFPASSSSLSTAEQEQLPAAGGQAQHTNHHIGVLPAASRVRRPSLTLPAAVAAPTYDVTSMKLLVESCGDLYLVDRYTKEDPHYQENDDGRQYFIVSYFKVYKLNEEAHDWDEVTSIGDQMFFLGDTSFSVSALDFPIAEGNCIFFNNNRISLEQTDNRLEEDDKVGLYNLKDCSITELKSSLEIMQYTHAIFPQRSPGKMKKKGRKMKKD